MNYSHVDYPHNPGQLYDCNACEIKCYCKPGETVCVHCANLPNSRCHIVPGHVAHTYSHPHGDFYCDGDQRDSATFYDGPGVSYQDQDTADALDRSTRPPTGYSYREW